MLQSNETILENIDKAGDLFLNYYIIPLVKGIFKVHIEDNVLNKYFMNIKTAYISNKLTSFIKFLKNISDNDIIEYITNMNEVEKEYFISIINKVIEMDDELQIFILACLTKEYQQHGTLNYYETQLFYNISSISKQDFEIFHKIFEKKEDNKKISINNKSINEITNISLNKFVNLGLLINKQNSNIHNEIIINNQFYRESKYSKKLFSFIDDFYKKDFE